MKNNSTHLKEIAFELGVSINTVSRALRDCSDISEKTKRSVRRKAFELGYLPNKVSQFVKSESKKTIIFLVNDMKNFFFNIMCEKLLNLCITAKYDFSMIYTKYKKLNKTLVKQCISERADVIVSFFEPDLDAIEIAELYGVSLLFLGEYPTMDINYVCIDNKKAGALAATYLANVHPGNKYIYFGIPGYCDSEIKYKSFYNQVLSINKNAEITFIDATNNKNLDIVNKLYEGWLNVFCFNDQYAYALIKTLNRKIPNVRKVFKHLHIVGCDAVSSRIDGIEDLTSINYDYDELAKQVITIIKNIFSGTSEKQNACIPIFLHQRQ